MDFIILIHYIMWSCSCKTELPFLWVIGYKGHIESNHLHCHTTFDKTFIWYMNETDYIEDSSKGTYWKLFDKVCNSGISVMIDTDTPCITMPEPEPEPEPLPIELPTFTLIRTTSIPLEEIITIEYDEL